MCETFDQHCISFQPYRAVHDANSCILCGKSRGRMANPRDKCVCISMTFCAECSKDDEYVPSSFDFFKFGIAKKSNPEFSTDCTDYALSQKIQYYVTQG